MRPLSLCSAVFGIVVAQSMVAGPLLANMDTGSRPTASQPTGSISPLAIVAVYGMADPSILCAASASAAATQDPSGTQGQTPIPDPTQAGPGVEPPPSDGCVLPASDGTVTPATPPATSEIAPLLGLGPILAAVGLAGTGAAIAASNDESDSPVSPP
jgi:hypothetical protein